MLARKERRMLYCSASFNYSLFLNSQSNENNGSYENNVSRVNNANNAKKDLNNNYHSLAIFSKGIGLSATGPLAVNAGSKVTSKPRVIK